MATIEDAYSALKSVIDSIDGLRAFDYVPGNSEWPGAFILPPTVEYDSLADHVLKLTFTVVVLVSAVIDVNQRKLFKYQDPSDVQSVLNAIRSDPSLGDPGIHAYAVKSRSLNMVEQAGYEAFGCQFDVVMRLS